MGVAYSRPQFSNKMEIHGNHNLAFMLNGVHYNITNMIDEAIYEIVKKSRLDLIRIHFTSVLVILFVMILLFLLWLATSRQAVHGELNNLALKFLNIYVLFF